MHLHAKPFVIERIGEVAAEPADDAERELQDVGGRRGMMRPEPPPRHVKQGGLFLGAGERYSEVVLLSAAQWGGKGHIVQRLLAFILGQGRRASAIPTFGLFVPRQKMT